MTVAVLGAVLFDLDGLLADTESLHYEAWRGVLEEIGLRVGWREYCEQWIRAGHGIEEYLRRQGVCVAAGPLRAQKSLRYLNLLAARVRPMPGAIELLARLHRRVPLALATSSWRRHAEAVLQHLQIAPMFHVIAVAESVPRVKPAPDIFLHAARSLAVAPRACVVLENAEKGVRAARAAGMAVVAVPGAAHGDERLLRRVARCPLAA
jgi:HAD superfamily hydrolase (TIGR01509 family)